MLDPTESKAEESKEIHACGDVPDKFMYMPPRRYDTEGNSSYSSSQLNNLKKTANPRSNMQYADSTHKTGSDCEPLSDARSNCRPSHLSVQRYDRKEFRNIQDSRYPPAITSSLFEESLLEPSFGSEEPQSPKSLEDPKDNDWIIDDRRPSQPIHDPQSKGNKEWNLTPISDLEDKTVYWGKTKSGWNQRSLPANNNDNFKDVFSPAVCDKEDSRYRSSCDSLINPSSTSWNKDLVPQVYDYNHGIPGSSKSEAFTLTSNIKSPSYSVPSKLETHPNPSGCTSQRDPRLLYGRVNPSLQSSSRSLVAQKIKVPSKSNGPSNSAIANKIIASDKNKTKTASLAKTKHPRSLLKSPPTPSTNPQVSPPHSSQQKDSVSNDTGNSSEKKPFSDDYCLRSDDESFAVFEEKQVFSCEYCSYVGKKIVSHYVNRHPQQEVPIKISEESLKNAIEEQNTAPSTIKNISKDDSSSDTSTDKSILDDLSWIPERSIFTRPVDCKVCGYTTVVKTNLLQHLIAHRNPEKNSLGLQFASPLQMHCQFCEFSVSNAQDFRDHVTAHTGEFFYSCGYCRFRGFSSKSVRSHISYTHAGKPPFVKRDPDCKQRGSWLIGYVCSECRFIQLSEIAVQKHIEVKHLKTTTEIIKINMSRSQNLKVSKKIKEEPELSKKDTLRKSCREKDSSSDDHLMMDTDSDNEPKVRNKHVKDLKKIELHPEPQKSSSKSKDNESMKEIGKETVSNLVPIKTETEEKKLGCKEDPENLGRNLKENEMKICKVKHRDEVSSNKISEKNTSKKKGNYLNNDVDDLKDNIGINKKKGNDTKKFDVKNLKESIKKETDKSTKGNNLSAPSVQNANRSQSSESSASKCKEKKTIAVTEKTKASTRKNTRAKANSKKQSEVTIKVEEETVDISTNAETLLPAVSNKELSITFQAKRTYSSDDSSDNEPLALKKLKSLEKKSVKEKLEEQTVNNTVKNELVADENSKNSISLDKTSEDHESKTVNINLKNTGDTGSSDSDDNPLKIMSPDFNDTECDDNPMPSMDQPHEVFSDNDNSDSIDKSPPHLVPIENSTTNTNDLDTSASCLAPSIAETISRLQATLQKSGTTGKFTGSDSKASISPDSTENRDSNSTPPLIDIAHTSGQTNDNLTITDTDENELPFIFKCGAKQCGFFAAKEKLFLQHVESNHYPREGPCSECGSSFAVWSLLMKHIKNDCEIQKKPPRFRCGFSKTCTFYTSSEEIFFLHTNKMHARETQLPCYHCDKKLSLIVSLISHIKSFCPALGTERSTVLPQNKNPLKITTSVSSSSRRKQVLQALSSNDDVEFSCEEESNDSIIMPSLQVVYRCPAAGCDHKSLEQEVFRSHVADCHKNCSMICLYCECEQNSLEELMNHTESNHKDEGWNRTSGSILGPSSIVKRCSDLSLRQSASDTNKDLLEIEETSKDKSNEMQESKDNEMSVDVPEIQETSSKNHGSLDSCMLPKIVNVVSLTNSDWGEDSEVLRIWQVGSLSSEKSELKQAKDSNVNPTSENAENTIPNLTSKLLPLDVCRQRDPSVASLSFKTTEALDAMLNEEKLINLFKCMGSKCAFTTDSEESFLSHLFCAAECCSRVVCSYCLQEFTSANSLVEHIMRIHGHCTFQCKYCFYRAAMNSYVLLHQQKRHPDSVTGVHICTKHPGSLSPEEEPVNVDLVIPYKCAIGDCKFEVADPDEFRNHNSKEHVGASVFPCHHCGVACLSANRLLTHYKLHGCNNYQCGYCLHGSETEEEILFHLCSMHPSKRGRILVRSVVENKLLPGFKQQSSCNDENLFKNSPKLKSDDEELQGLEIDSSEDVKPSIGNETDAAADMEKLTDDDQEKNLKTEKDNQIQEDKVQKKDDSALEIDVNSKSNKKITPNIPNSTDCPTQPQNFKAEEKDEMSKFDLKLKRISTEGEIIRDAGSPNKKLKADNSAEVNSSKSSLTADVASSCKSSSEYHVRHEGKLGHALFQCGYPPCTYSASTAEPLREHMVSCRNSREKQFVQCPHCPCQWRTVTVFLEHMVTQHGGRRFGCGRCPFRGPTCEYVQNHMKLQHGIPPEQTDCILKDSKADPEIGEYLIHEKKCTILTSMQPNKSPEKKTSSAKGFLRRGASYGVDDCEKLPMQSIFPKEVFCSVCGYSTKVRSNLIRHLQLHRRQGFSAETEADQEKIENSSTNKLRDKTETHPNELQESLSISSQILTLPKNTGENTEEAAIDSSIITKPSEISTDLPNKEIDLKNDLLHSEDIPSALDVSSCPQFVAETSMFRCVFEGCSYLALDIFMYKCHVNTLHPDQSSFQCPHCTVKLNSLDRLSQHFRLHGPRLFKCGRCHYVSSRRHPVEAHTRSAHHGQFTSVIMVRDLTIEEREAKQDKIHDTEKNPVVTKPSNSKISSPVFTGSSNRTNNELRNNWGCFFCDFQGQTKMSVKKHLQTSHNIRSEYKCSLCTCVSNAYESVRLHFVARHPGTEVNVVPLIVSLNLPSSRNTLPEGFQRMQSLNSPDSLPVADSVSDVIKDIPPVKSPVQSRVSSPSNTTKTSEETNANSSVTLPRNGLKIKIDLKTRSTSTSSMTSSPKSSDLTSSTYSVSTTSSVATPVKAAETALTTATNLFVCPVCKEYQTRFRGDMRIHIYREIQYRRIQCSYCSAQFISEKEGKQHNSKSHRGFAVSLTKKEIPEKELWIKEQLDKQLRSWNRTPRSGRSSSTAGGNSNDDMKTVGASSDSHELDSTISEDNVEFPEGNETLLDVDNSVSDRRFRYYCPQCSYHCEGTTDLRKHIFRHLKFKPFQCKFCTRRFGEKQQLRSHHMLLHKEQELVYDCDPDQEPERLFVDSLLRQQRLEWKKKKAIGGTVAADATEDLNEDQKASSSAENSSSSVFKCTYEGCQFSCEQAKGLKVHSVSHLRQAKFHCGYCSLTGNSQYQLRRHCRSVHSDRKVLVLPIKSNARFAMHKDINQAFSMVDLGKSSQCPYCPYSHSVPKMMSRHIRRHYVQKPFQCGYCEQEGIERFEIVTHIRKKHPDKPINVIAVPMPSNPEIRPILKRGHPCRRVKIIQDNSESISQNSIGNTVSQLQIEGKDSIGGVPLLTFECYLCQSQCHSEKDIKTHLKEVHKENGPLYRTIVSDPTSKSVSFRTSMLKCIYCDLASENYKLLKKHCQENHIGNEIRLRRLSPDWEPNGECLLRCGYCGVAVQLITALWDHHKTEHNSLPAKFRISQRKLDETDQPLFASKGRKKKLLYRCSYCKDSCNSVIKMERHWKMFHGHLEFKYTNLSRNQNSQEDNLIGEKMLETSSLESKKEPSHKIYRCSRCKYDTDKYDIARQHLFRHLQRFICYICNKTFPFEYELKKHFEVHHSDMKVEIKKNPNYSDEQKEELIKNIQVINLSDCLDNDLKDKSDKQAILEKITDSGENTKVSNENCTEVSQNLKIVHQRARKSMKGSTFVHPSGTPPQEDSTQRPLIKKSTAKKSTSSRLKNSLSFRDSLLQNTFSNNSNDSDASLQNSNSQIKTCQLNSCEELPKDLNLVDDTETEQNERVSVTISDLYQMLNIWPVVKLKKV